MTALSSNHDCIKFWEEEYEEVVNALRLATAEKQDAEQTKICLTSWEDSLKMYWEKIEETNKKAKSCSTEIERFSESSTQVKELTTTTVGVADMAYCMVLDFFKSMDVLKEDISNLLKAIECLNNPDINAKSSIVMGKVTELKIKLDSAISTQTLTINTALDTLECARDLDTAVGNIGTDEAEESDPSGLLWLLDELYDLFNTQTEAEAAASASEGSHRHRRGHRRRRHHRHHQHFTAYGMGCEQPEKSCNASITPKPILPLDQDPYYKKIKTQYEAAKAEQDAAEEAVAAAKSTEDTLISSKESLSKAITKAKAAKGC